MVELKRNGSGINSDGGWENAFTDSAAVLKGDVFTYSR